MSLPSAIFVSSGEVLPVDIIEKVLNGNLPDAVQIGNNISAYEWRIDNKYYTAVINLCSLSSKEIIAGDFANSVEAIVIYFDSDNSQGLEIAESWLPFLDVYDPEIKILVCKNCADEVPEGNVGICKLTAQEWCIQRGFELVELEPSLEDVNPDDDFLETTGVERIRQALNAHQWPKLILKSERDNNIGLNGAAGQSGERMNRGIDILDLYESDSELDFVSLLSNLREVKEKLSTMSSDARKEAAERVVRDFWRAMGGDEDELDEMQLLRLMD